MDSKEAEELSELRTIVSIFNRAIRKLSKKYLREAPRGRLPLESFFELILAKARKIGMEKALDEVLSGVIRNRIEQVRSRVDQMAKGSFLAKLDPRDVLFIPVLVRKAHRKEISLKRYRAISLRGGFGKAVAAETPEEAYRLLRGLMEDELPRRIDTLASCKKDLMGEYDAAKFLADDVVAGFRVIVKVSEVDYSMDEQEEGGDDA